MSERTSYPKVSTIEGVTKNDHLPAFAGRYQSHVAHAPVADLATRCLTRQLVTKIEE